MNDNESLEKELQRLKKITGKNENFLLVWSPTADSPIEGRVTDNTITIYSQGILKATETLRHEFVDCIVSSAIGPYVKLINLLLSSISEDAYGKKEKSVEELLKLCKK